MTVMSQNVTLKSLISVSRTTSLLALSRALAASLLFFSIPSSIVPNSDITQVPAAVINRLGFSTKVLYCSSWLWWVDKDTKFYINDFKLPPDPLDQHMLISPHSAPTTCFDEVDINYISQKGDNICCLLLHPS